MASYKSANLTKVDAGGSGDNYVDDGYIKTVEKVWIDTFTISEDVGSGVITTSDTLAIANIPAGKKVTDVEVYFSAAIVPTEVTINVGVADDADKFIKEGKTATSLTEEGALVSVDRVSMNNADGIAWSPTASTDILLSVSEDTTAPTNGTITTIVKYT